MLYVFGQNRLLETTLQTLFIASGVGVRAITATRTGVELNDCQSDFRSLKEIDILSGQFVLINDQSLVIGQRSPY